MSYTINLSSLTSNNSGNVANDRRFDPRIDVTEAIRVIEVEGTVSLGLVLDLSEDGMCVRTFDEIPQGSEHAFRLEVTPYGENLQFIDLKALCVWCLPLRQEGFRIGFQFVHRSAKARLRLSALLKRLYLDQNIQ